MVFHLAQYIFPAIKKEELRKFIVLGMVGFFVVGSYWFIRLLKQVIFFKIAFPESLGWAPEQGSIFQPLALLWSPFVVLAVVLIYSKLIDLYRKDQLFYIICIFYGLLFGVIGTLLMIKEWYGPEVLGKTLLATVGWTSYFAIETFGPLIVSLFWAFANSITDTESAKRGFPLIITLMQIGAIGGSVLLLASTSIGMVWPFVVVATVFICAVAFMICYFVSTMPEDQMIGNRLAHATEMKKDGFFEGFIKGLTLLLTRPYLFGVFIISTFCEIAMHIVEYQMHRHASLCPDYGSEVAFCWFEGLFGVGVNGLAFIVALLGSGYIIRKLGTRLALLVYPTIFAITILALFLFFKSGTTANQLLWLTFATMVIVKGLGYAFNNPVKEIMYIPTSKDAKFKSKGWTDMFGARFVKSTSLRITHMYKHNVSDLMAYGTLLSCGLIGILIIATLYVGKKNQELIQEGKIIE